jgi:N-acetylglutamate synthase-like GNAT family acetyltransferase
MRLYFIGGASGSGKTAVMPHLKELLGDGIAVYDFDDIGVPDGADKKWRGESTEKWLQKLLSEGKDACLLGQIVLGEILSCPSAKQIDKINFCLLDVSDFERIGRLKKRNTYGADQNMLNWAAWLRMHNQDPQWASHVIQEDAASIMDFTKLFALKSYEEVANVKILDTTDLALHEVAGELADWVNHTENTEHSQPIPNTGYMLEFNAPNAYNTIDQKLFEFNKLCVPSTQKPEVINLNFTIKNDDEVIAGICADVYIWQILYISVFFIEENYRHQGLGTILLNKVEEKAKQLGATLSHLDTFNHQAKDFYLKHGYEIFGVLENCPTGQKRYFMKKVLV